MAPLAAGEAIACPPMTAANVNGITIEYDVHGDDGDDRCCW